MENKVSSMSLNELDKGKLYKIVNLIYSNLDNSGPFMSAGPMGLAFENIITKNDGSKEKLLTDVIFDASLYGYGAELALARFSYADSLDWKTHPLDIFRLMSDNRILLDSDAFRPDEKNPLRYNKLLAQFAKNYNLKIEH